MSLHLKRLNAPRSWHIPRKTGGVFVTKPSPGAHAVADSIPLTIVMRDMLGIADTARLVSQIVSDRAVLIDGAPAKSIKEGVGLMDIVSLPALDKHYRMMLDRRGRLKLQEIPASSAQWKLCRVENKTVVKGGKLQINLHDGRNVLTKETGIKTGDVVKLHLPDQKILGTYPLAAGATAFLTGGAHAGETGTVQAEEVTKSSKENLVSLASGDQSYATVKSYVFVIGKDRAEIELPEVNA